MPLKLSRLVAREIPKRFQLKEDNIPDRTLMLHLPGRVLMSRGYPLSGGYAAINEGLVTASVDN